MGYVRATRTSPLRTVRTGGTGRLAPRPHQRAVRTARRGDHPRWHTAAARQPVLGGGRADVLPAALLHPGRDEVRHDHPLPAPRQAPAHRAAAHQGTNRTRTQPLPHTRTRTRTRTCTRTRTRTRTPTPTPTPTATPAARSTSSSQALVVAPTRGHGRRRPRSTPPLARRCTSCTTAAPSPSPRQATVAMTCCWQWARSVCARYRRGSTSTRAALHRPLHPLHPLHRLHPLQGLQAGSTCRLCTRSAAAPPRCAPYRSPCTTAC